MIEIDKIKIKNNLTIRDALRRVDRAGIGFAVAVDDNDIVVGILSDGDFRRAMLNDTSLDEKVGSIVNKSFLSVGKNYEKQQIKRIFSNTKVQHLPIIESGKLINIIIKESFYNSNSNKIVNKKKLNNLVVIMAGGKGTRLDPFTRILPKALIPIGNDPIIKVIMDNFSEYGMNDFYISVNDKSRMIKSYFHDHSLNYDINFIEEDKPLGTAGSLKNIHEKTYKPFFVSNCDIIVKCNLEEVLDFHVDRKYDLTLIVSMQHYTIPYGVCKINNGGDLLNIIEKPEYDYLTNTGMYLINPDVLKYIPDNTYFDMTTLIDKLQENNIKVGVFPVSSKSWFDVGQWPEYEKTNAIFSVNNVFDKASI